jgi:hypothetical protein
MLRIGIFGAWVALFCYLALSGILFGWPMWLGLALIVYMGTLLIGPYVRR